MLSKRELEKMAGRLMSAREKTRVACDRVLNVAREQEKQTPEWAAEMRTRAAEDLHVAMDELSKVCNTLEDDGDE